jgi:hypothetical protein
MNQPQMLPLGDDLARFVSPILAKSEQKRTGGTKKSKIDRLDKIAKALTDVPQFCSEVARKTKLSPCVVQNYIAIVGRCVNDVKPIKWVRK